VSAACASDDGDANASGGSGSAGGGNGSAAGNDGSAGGGNGNGNAGSGTGGGTVAPPQAPTCAAATSGSSGPVQAPVLVRTLPASWDENWFASPALVDLDGDGKREIVAARHSVLYAWRADGTQLFFTAFGESAKTSPEHGGTRMWASPVVGDFDGDGSIEIAVGADADSTQGMNVAVYDATGTLRAGFPQHFGGKDEVRSITAADIDGNGVLDVIVNKTNAGPATAAYGLDGKMLPGWPEVQAAICDPAPPAEKCWDFGGYNQNVGAGDLDGDGLFDVVSSYDAIGFGFFHGSGKPFATAAAFTDRVGTSVEAYHDLALAEQGWGKGDRSEFTYSPPVIADIDGDGTPNVVFAADWEHSDDTTNKGIALWVVNPDMSRPAGWTAPKEIPNPQKLGELGQNIVSTRPSPAVGDLGSQKGLEIVFPAYDGKMHAFSPDGTELWSYVFGKSPAPYNGASEPLIVDLNGDGSPEVVFTTYSSGEPRKPETPAHLVILDASGHELHEVEIFGRGSMAAPSIADLDGDGTLELVISLKDTLGGKDGGVQIWSLPGSSPNCVLWSTGRGNPLRQGLVPKAP
jgi:hypothetical protein